MNHSRLPSHLRKLQYDALVVRDSEFCALTEQSRWKGNKYRRCASEGMQGERASEKPTLTVDHVDGIKTHNEAENLRLLCKRDQMIEFYRLHPRKVSEEAVRWYERERIREQEKAEVAAENASGELKTNAEKRPAWLHWVWVQIMKAEFDSITADRAIYTGARDNNISSVTTRRYLKEEVKGDEGSLMIVAESNPVKIALRPRTREILLMQG